MRTHKNRAVNAKPAYLVPMDILCITIKTLTERFVRKEYALRHGKKHANHEGMSNH